MKVLIDLLKEEVENCKQKALTICDEIDAKKLTGMGIGMKSLRNRYSS